MIQPIPFLPCSPLQRRLPRPGPGVMLRRQGRLLPGGPQDRLLLPLPPHPGLPHRPLHHRHPAPAREQPQASARLPGGGRDPAPPPHPPVTAGWRQISQNPKSLERATASKSSLGGRHLQCGGGARGTYCGYSRGERSDPPFLAVRHGIAGPGLRDAGRDRI